MEIIRICYGFCKRRHGGGKDGVVDQVKDIGE
jgi:hypothetical protein